MVTPAGRRLGLPRVNPVAVAAALPAAVILALIGYVLWMSVHAGGTSGPLTLDHFRSLVDDDSVTRAMLNTLGFATTSLAVAMVFGVTIAWIVVRTDFRGKALVYGSMAVGILVPGFISAMGWIFLFHPQIGVANDIPVIRSLTFNLLSLYGMGFVQGLGLAGVVFVMTVASLRAMDASLEEAAQVSGAGFLGTMRRVTLPLAWPGLLGAALFVLVIGVSAFDVPLIIGLSNRIYTFSTFIYVQLNPDAAGVPDYGLAAAFSAVMIALAVLLSVWYTRVLAHARRYEVVTGKNYQPRTVALGRWSFLAWAFVLGWLLLAMGLPLAMVTWSALLPYLQTPSMDALDTVSLDNFRNLPWDLVRRGIGHSLILVFVAPTLAMLFSLAFSWVVLRSRSRLRFAYDYAAFLPHGVPSVIFAFSMLVITLNVVPSVGPIEVYGSMLPLVVIYAIVGLAFGTRVTNGALIQIHRELEDAAYMSGATTASVIRRVVVPLLRPALLFGWLWLAMLAFRELTMATVLGSSDNLTLPVIVFTTFRGANQGQAAAISLIMVALLVPLVLVYLRVGGVLTQIKGEAPARQHAPEGVAAQPLPSPADLSGRLEEEPVQVGAHH